MIVSILPLPEEPLALKSLVRALLEQAPDEGLPLVLEGVWLADPLWSQWGAALERRGMDRTRFGEIVAGYANELRLWVVGERPWEQAAGGLAGRVARRLGPDPATVADPRPGAAARWQEALHRVGVDMDTEMPALIERIGELHLLYEIAAPGKAANDAASATAIVWAGARPRDPEVPFGEGQAEAAGAAVALAEALGRFLLKDPAYPPR